MEIIPAIDFKDGKVVNLVQGQLDQSTTYSDNPIAMADRWVEMGASRLHLVDLDGAFEGRPVNRDAIAAIARNHPNLTIQLGGGIRSAEVIEGYLEAGVSYLIIGTKAVEEPEFVGEMCKRFPGHIIVGLDGLHGMVGGVSLQSTRELAEAVNVPIIASGGVTDIKDIEALCETGKRVTGGIAGVITGRAIYEGTLDLREAIALARAYDAE